MAFVSIGQKYGFVSIGDYFRQQMAEKIEERVGKERQQFEKKLADEHNKLNKAEEEKINTARKMVSDQKLTIEEASAYFKLSKEEIMGK